MLNGVPRLNRRQATSVLAIVLASLVLSFLLEQVFGQFVSLQPQAIRDWLHGWGPLAPAVYIVLLAAAVVITPIPSVPLDIASGLAFGLLWGTVYTLVGAELGALIAFWLARRLGRAWLARRLGPVRTASIDRLTERLGGRAVFAMRLIPAFNFDWVSYAAGLTNISAVTYALSTFLGMILPVIAIVAVGDSLTTDPKRSAIIFAALVVLWAAPLLWWMRPRRNG